MADRGRGHALRQSRLVSVRRGAALRERLRGIDVARLIRDGTGAPDGAALVYPVSRDVVSSLASRRGAAVLRAFLHDYVDDPRAWPALFARHFGLTFDTALADFAREG